MKIENGTFCRLIKDTSFYLGSQIKVLYIKSGKLGVVKKHCDHKEWDKSWVEFELDQRMSFRVWVDNCDLSFDNFDK